MLRRDGLPSRKLAAFMLTEGLRTMDDTKRRALRRNLQSRPPSPSDAPRPSTRV
ncbi:MAG: hypothetical protein NVS3B10_14800 [Polyangiales bacterium]